MIQSISLLLKRSKAENCISEFQMNVLYYLERNVFTSKFIRYYSSATLFHSPFKLLQFMHLSTSYESLPLTKQIHARILLLGLTQNPFLASKLLSLYALFGHLPESRLIFDSLKDRNICLWNSMINGYLKSFSFIDAFRLFCKMGHFNVKPDDFTLATVLKVAAEIDELKVGELVHCLSIKTGFVLNIVVSNSLISMYRKYREFDGMKKVFDEMPEKNVSSWNALISGYANSGAWGMEKLLWEEVKNMQIQGVKLDGITISSILPLSGAEEGIRGFDYGRELHCYILKNDLDSGFGADVHLGCCLIDMYSRSNKVLMGRNVFDRMRFRNVYAWTAMINGYVENGNFDEALLLFQEMQLLDRIEPNKVSLVSVLPACSSYTGLMAGKQIHGYAIRKELNRDVALCNALINMYSKCGNLTCAEQVFENGRFSKDAISWSSMISSFGLHGKGEEAVCLYERMLLLGNKPDPITVVGVLSACGRSGLINKGLSIYNSIINDYGMKPTAEICACVVDILGRSGQLDQALEFIKTMPVEPGPSVWGALVNASVMHKNLHMQDLSYRSLIQLEPENPSNYISLSNLLASSKSWDSVAELRKMMKERGLRKAPGCSWISINGKRHCFYVADKAHSHFSLIYGILDDLITIMKGAGYYPLDEELKLISDY